MTEKLQKILANAGYGSRRELETWISDGRVTVNGKRASLGDRATTQDRILVDGKLARLTNTKREQIKALIYHKPEGQICTRKDNKGRPTVFDNLPSIANGRWIAIGRLDINTSGLLLFTNNGDLANKLMHPSTGLEREYLVRVRGAASAETIQKLMSKGVMIDGKSARFDSVESADLSEEGTNHWYRVVIREGRYREVRRMWEAVNHTVSRLKRIRYGTVKLTRDVKQGQYTKMAPMQLEKLIKTVNLDADFKGSLYSDSKPTGQKTAGRKPVGYKKTERKSTVSRVQPRRSKNKLGANKKPSGTTAKKRRR